MEFVVNPDEDDPEKVASVIYFWTSQKIDSINPEQKKLSKQQEDKTVDKGDKKYFCNNLQCKKEITKDIVAWCLFKDEEGRTRFDGKVYCRECQEGK